MVTKKVEVVQIVQITVDETKFTPEFMTEFRQSFYPFDTLDEHITHLGQMYVRGVIGDLPSSFIEGYGPASDMGFVLEEASHETTTEIVS